MEVFYRGDIVLVPFPFSGEEKYKVRPAVVLASVTYAGGLDYLLCAITTRPADDSHRLPLAQSEVIGRLTETVFIRPGYLFTAGEYFIKRRIAKLKPEKFTAVIQIVHSLLNQPDV